MEDVPPEYLADGTEILDAVLAAELERREVVFVQLTLVEGLRRWIRATDAIGGLLIDIDGVKEESVQQAQRQLVDLLLEEFDAAGVIWPDVRERKARKKRRSLVWDRVVRRIPGVGAAEGFRSPRLGSSLRVRIFGSDAELVSDEYHGLEVIHRRQELRRETSDMMQSIWFAFPVRTDLFEDRKLLGRTAQRSLPSEWP